MPMYRVKCPDCSAEQDIFLKMSEYDNLPSCPCGGKTYRKICAPAVQANFEAYVSPKTGKFIESRDAQREDLKVSGSFLMEPGVREDITLNRLANEEKTFAPVAAAIDATVTSLVNSGKIES